LPAAQSMHLLAEAGGLSVERLFLDLWYWLIESLSNTYFLDVECDLNEIIMKP
jgi:hypothetical protein